MKDQQLAMFDGMAPLPEREKIGREKFKKPVEIFGPGPEGKTCKTCSHHIDHRMTKVYHKCAVWRLSYSSATDIRTSWPACGKYEEVKRTYD